MYWLKVLFTPLCWLQNNSYSAGWDFELRELMNEHDFVYIDQYIAKIGGVIIWIENHPYSSFHPWSHSFFHKHETGLEYDDNVCPRRATILEAMDKFKHDCLLQN